MCNSHSGPKVRAVPFAHHFPPHRSLYFGKRLKEKEPGFRPLPGTITYSFT